MDSKKMKRRAEGLHLEASEMYLGAGHDFFRMQNVYLAECQAYGKLLGAYRKLESEKKEVK